MFCGSITESLPRQVPHLPQCSYGLGNSTKHAFSKVYLLQWM